MDDDVRTPAMTDESPLAIHHSSDQLEARGSWLRSIGVDPVELAGKVIVAAAYKGGVGKTFLAYELAYMLGGILVDLDWDMGNASRAWGFREESRKGAPLLDAFETGRTPRPIAGGPWRADLVPCHTDFAENQPSADDVGTAIERWAAEWAITYKCPVVVDTHPGAGPSTFGAVSAAHRIVVPVVLGEREMEALDGMVRDLKSHPLLLVPNKVGISPPGRYIDRLAHIAQGAGVPVGPVIGKYDWLTTRSRRMAISASDPVPARAVSLIDEVHRVGKVVVDHVLAA